MARSDSRTRLRDFQAQLAERLAQAKSAPVTASRLGFQINDGRWLIDLAEAGEIVPLQDMTPVPHTHDWYRGLVNIRGNLVSVIDLSAFLGEAPTRIERDSRILSFSASLDFNAALLVTRMLGLHSPAAWQPEAHDAGSAAADWRGPRWRDALDQSWGELGLAALAHDEKFLRIGAL